MEVNGLPTRGPRAVCALESAVGSAVSPAGRCCPVLVVGVGGAWVRVESSDPTAFSMEILGREVEEGMGNGMGLEGVTFCVAFSLSSGWTLSP